MIIQAFKLPLSKSELMSRIPKDLVAKLKSEGKKPYFQAYTVVHEGTSTPKELNTGEYQSISWTKEAVRSVAGVIKKGLQFFIGHNKDNSTEGRTSLGEVVTDFQKEVAGKLHHIVVGLFPDRKTAENFDVCSIEADVKLAPAAKGYIAKAIKNITGIALGNSQSDTPAFDGATMLASVQCMQPEVTNKEEGDSKMPEPYNYHKVKEAQKELNIFAHQLYTLEDLKNDRKFGPIIEEWEKLKEDNKALKDQVTQAEESLLNEKKSTAKATATDKLNRMIPEGATKLQKEFYKENFNPDKIDDLSEDGIRNFLVEAEEQYQKNAKLFGVKESSEDSTPTTGSDGPNDGVEATNIDDLAQAIVAG